MQQTAARRRCKMCIIAVKRAESAPPNETILREMFNRNADGAGIAYAKDGVLHIIKGLMQADEFIKAAQKIPQDAAAIYHCRIQTSGGVVKELTHPFLIDKDIKQQRQTRVTTNKGAALAHNGIFTQYHAKELNNDTTQFITNNIAPLAALKEQTGGSILDKDIHNIIEELTGNNKIAILTADGNIETFGSFWIEDGGIKYSNSTYKKIEYCWTYTGARNASKKSGAVYAKDFARWADNYANAQILKKTSKAFADLCKEYKRMGLDEAETYALYINGELD